MTKTSLRFLVLLLSILSGAAPAFGQGTAFLYQGTLVVGGSAANGSYDLQFGLFDSPTAGNAQGGIIFRPAWRVTNGLIVSTLDFGAGAFDGSARWLEIAVRPTGTSGDPTTLSPRQPVMPSPYAVRAGNASLLNGLAPTEFAPATGSDKYLSKSGDTMSGPLALPANGLAAGVNQLVLTGGNVGIGTLDPQVKLQVAGIVRAGAFQGDGTGLTGVAPAGTAGGDLAGSYPSPVLGNNSVTSAKIADGTITDADISPAAALSGSKIGNGQVVKSINSLKDAVSITAGANVTVATVGNGLQISATSATPTLATLGIKSGSVSVPVVSGNGFGTATVTFGTAYPNANYSVVLTPQTYQSGGTTARVDATFAAKTANGFTIHVWAGVSATLACNWMTVPYSN